MGFQVEHTESGKTESVCDSFYLNMVFCTSYAKDFIICGLLTSLAGEAPDKKNPMSKESLCSDQQNTLLCQHRPFAVTAVTPPCTGLGPVDLGDSCWHSKKDNVNSE